MIKIIKNRKGQEFQVLIDDEYEEFYDKHTWCLNNGYVVTNIRINGKYKIFRFYRMIMNIEDPKVFIDHINGNTLDNRKSNLRLASNQQNNMNRRSNKKSSSSIFKGTSWDKNNKKWKSQIRYNNKLIHLGYFTSEIEAAKAYDLKAKELFGEFAFLNFPED